MWTCKGCLQRQGRKVPSNLLIRACDVCGSHAVECAIESQKVNIEDSNWHKYSEAEDISSSPVQKEIPENGLYIWLR